MLRLIISPIPSSILLSTDKLIRMVRTCFPILWHDVVVVSNATYKTETHKINCGKGLDKSLSLITALSTMQVTVEFGLVPSQFVGEHSEGGQWPSTSLPLFLQQHKKTCDTTAI
ncbi:hypothetical protein TNCV_2708501 [Trichonephila clavipes]|nr:hypothetical protein TNCV_2708501 [Trichonephila clavipes]